VANNDHTISVFDAQTFALIARVKNNTGIPNTIQAIPGTDKFIFDDQFGDTRATIIEAPSGRIVSTKKFQHRVWVTAFS
jgi:DNA-binding beta-propeller fold protein YncE